MHPYIEIFGQTISTYFLFALAGLLAVCIFNVFRMKRISLKAPGLFLLLIICAVFLLVFSRFLYAIAMIPEKGFSAKTFLNDLLHGGIVFYGGMFGVIAGCLVFALITHRKARVMLDYFAPSIPLFHSIARLGCLFGGCCYGIECSFGVPNTRFPGTLLFPVQLIESICNLLIFIAMIVLEKKRNDDRFNLEIYFASYGVCRFVLEFFRADTNRGIWCCGLSTSQCISLLLILFVIAETVVLAIKKRSFKNQ